ncbi:MAG: hypothetical protein H0W28_13710 [Pyrinomonadaceae bacterium]|nr:hypothetical protein [Pyrinomonadaceae bacterium]
MSAELSALVGRTRRITATLLLIEARQVAPHRIRPPVLTGSRGAVPRPLRRAWRDAGEDQRDTEDSVDVVFHSSPLGKPPNAGINLPVRI